MRDYAKIAPQFWVGQTGKEIRRLGRDAQVVALYLISSPHANMIGMYHLPIAYMAADTGMDFEGASEGLRRLSQAGFCGYDTPSEVVWIYEMARFQIGDALKPGDKQCVGVQNTYDNVPQNPFLPLFFEKYAAPFHMKKQRGYDAPYKPLGSQEQEQEKEQEQEQGNAPPASPPSRPKKPSDKAETALQASCRETLKAYASAYWDRYQTEPVVNVKVRSQIKQFCQRLSHDEAPLVAAFYISHSASYYVRKGHDVGSMLADAEKLRTEWATNRAITDTQARQVDRTATNANVAEEAMQLLREQGVA